MTRYAQQRQWYTCAPTLILNALKWAGGRHTILRDLPDIIKKSKCRKTVPGSLLKHLESALCYFGKNYFIVKKKRWRGVRAIKKLLTNPENAVVTLYLWKKPETGECGEHFILLLGMSEDGKAFRCVNYHDAHTEAESLIPWKIFSKDHRRQRSEGGGLYPDIWLLTKKQNS